MRTGREGECSFSFYFTLECRYWTNINKPHRKQCNFCQISFKFGDFQMSFVPVIVPSTRSNEIIFKQWQPISLSKLIFFKELTRDHSKMKQILVFANSSHFILLKCWIHVMNINRFYFQNLILHSKIFITQILNLMLENSFKFFNHKDWNVIPH